MAYISKRQLEYLGETLGDMSRHKITGGFFCCGGGKSSPPPAPDYTAAAQATAQGNLEATRAATDANRVNQVTPYGNLTYTHDSGQTFNQAAYDAAMQDYYNQLAAYNAQGTTSTGSTSGNRFSVGDFGGGPLSVNRPGTVLSKPVMPNQADFMTGGNPDGGWTATQTLSPDQQAILDATSQLNLGLLGTANSGLNYANGVLSKPGVDTSMLPQVGINPGQSYQDAMMARIQPQIDRENQQLDAQLANQGITPGSQAYNNAKQLMYQQHNDLLNNATVQGFNTGLAANQNAFQQASYNQMQPINVINALRTGSQVQNPNFVNVPQQATVTGPDYLGAAQAQYNGQLNSYNAQVGNQNSFMSGLMGIGGSLLSAPSTSILGSFLASDRRLKENIKEVGRLENGLTVYSYNFIGSPATEIGLIAQDVEKVKPEAVMTHPDGYKMVNYALASA